MSVTVRVGVFAASIFALTVGFAPAPYAQQAALSAGAELAAKGEWAPATTYAKDDIVTARGSAWIAKRKNMGKVPGQTAPSTANDWQLFARGFNPTGAWSNTTTYHPDDLVTFNGQTFRAKRTKSASQPAANAFWELLAQKGANGEAGPQGAQGPQGDQGPATPGIEIALGFGSTVFLHNRGTANTGLGRNALRSNLTGLSNTGVGDNALSVLTSGDGNTAVGALSLSGNQTGQRNNALGYAALRSTNGNDNVAMGYEALHSNTSGSFNVGIGTGAVAGNTNGSNNTALGYLTLNNNSGSGNIAVGYRAGGSAWNSSNGIFIGNTGVLADTATIKIGTAGTQTSAFMAGIRDIPTGVNDAIAVMIDSSGQLGTVSSSQRYKTEIEAMADVSTTLAALRPVTFRYKQAQSDGSHPLQYGLIAEDVANVFPDLAVFNKDGNAETVKYHLLPSFLLAGWQAQQKTIAAQTDRIEALEQSLRRLEALLPQTRAAALQP